MVKIFRIAQVCDTHLSATHAYFEDNWHVMREALQAQQPDLVVHGGDLSFNGPAQADDLEHAAAEMAALEIPWVGIAGNHDIGEAPDFSRLGQPLTDDRIGAWRRHVGPLWWRRDVAAWRLIGLDTALMASGRDEEREQAEFLADALATREGRPVMVFLHMPPFVDQADNPAFTTSAIPFPARQALLDACVAGGVKVIACGHLHVYRRMRHRGMEIIWAPATAMVDSLGGRGGRRQPRPGFLIWELDGKRARHRLVEPPRAFIIDMKAWTRANGGTTTTLPPLPLRRPSARMRALGCGAVS